MAIGTSLKTNPLWSGPMDRGGARALVVLRAPWLWPYGGLLVLLGVVLWPAWFTSDQLVLGGDTLLIHYPWFVLWRDALAAGEFPFWNPYTFSGLPAFPTFQAGYAYPPHWLFTFVPAIPALNWLVGLHVLLAGCGTAWCAGRLGASREGQLLSGAAYALGSAMTARMWAGHLSFLEANAWLPLATGLAVQIRQRHVVVRLAMVVGLMVLAGQPELLIFSLWWLPAWAALPALRAGYPGLLRALARVSLGLGLGVALAAVLLVPALMLFSISNRPVALSWAFLTGGSLPPWHLLGALAPRLFGDPGGSYWPGPQHEWHERLLYIGLVPLLAAAWAPRPWRRVCWGGTALAVALAFGHYAGWYAWTQVLPGYGSFRVPSKHLVLAALALALAAGLGIDRLRGRRVLVVAATAAAVLGISVPLVAWWSPPAELLRGRPDLTMVPVSPDLPVTLDASAVHVASLVLILAGLAAQLPGLWARRVLLLLGVLDLVVVLQPYRFSPADPQAVVAEGDDLRGYGRAAIVGYAGRFLGNYGPLLRVVQPSGYTSLFSSQYAALVTGDPNPGVAIGVAEVDDPALVLLGYEVAIDPQRSLVAIQLTADGQPPPQAWVARCVWPGTALDVREADFPRQMCVARASAGARDEPVPPGPAALVAQGAGRLVVDADGPGWLVTAQPWYPGWGAQVDGAPGSVEAVDGALVGVELPPGSHRVTLGYRPAGLELGALISVAAGAVLLALWWGESSARGAGQLRRLRRRLGGFHPSDDPMAKARGL